MKRFQAEAGLSESGIADAATQSALYSSSAKASSIRSVSLSKGDKGEDVVRLQTRLTYLGYFSSSVDGDYGALTETPWPCIKRSWGSPPMAKPVPAR